jgi:hypothetical protein
MPEINSGTTRATLRARKLHLQKKQYTSQRNLQTTSITSTTEKNDESENALAAMLAEEQENMVPQDVFSESPTSSTKTFTKVTSHTQFSESSKMSMQCKSG